MKKELKTYTKEFKVEAVQLLQSSQQQRSHGAFGFQSA